MTDWMKNFLEVANEAFGERIWFVGLQGSRGRGEATEESDIDVVLILDELSSFDIQRYNLMLDSLPHRELVCGYISGKNELFFWEKSDLFHFYYDTKPVVGSLDELLPLIDNRAVERAVKSGACNIFHGCVHNMLHEKSDELLQDLYKSATFVIRAIVFLQTGNYFSCKEDLLMGASEGEATILNSFYKLKEEGTADFEKMSEALFEWVQTWIKKTR